MTNKEKKVVFSIIGIFVAILIVVLLVNGGKKGKEERIAQNDVASKESYAVELNDGTKLNTSEDMKKVKKYKDLEISNVQYTEKDGKTVMLADVKNTGATKHKAEIVKLTILGEDNKTLATLSPVIGDVEAGKTIKLNAIITGDVVNARDFKIEENK